LRRGALSRWNLLLERVSERLGKSSRVFLIGLLIACGIEVAVDWNSTLTEINVLRASLRQKAEDYVDILRRAAQPDMEAYDWDGLDELARGLFDDEDVVYVRFADALGNTLHDRVRGDYARSFERIHGRKFREHYRHQIDRDIGGMLTDPLQLRDRIAQSRHRDFIQAFTDAENDLVARFSQPKPRHEPPPQVLYQDRLYDDSRQLDRGLSYALGAMTSERGDVLGVVLMAFRHDRMNRAISGKLLKGLAITIFFVCLILLQNVLARRAKLRLLDLEAALSAARAAIRSTIPAAPGHARAELGVAFAQADRLGGTVYDFVATDDGAIELLLAVPEGAGVDAAFASVVLRDLYRRQPARRDPGERIAALLADYDAAPLGRRLELLCVRLHSDGAIDGVVAGLPAPSLIDAAGAVRAVPLRDPIAASAQRLAAPLRPFSCRIDEGVFVIFDDGLPASEPRRFDLRAALARIADRLIERRLDAQSAAEDVVAEAVKRYHKRHSDDFFALVVRAKNKQS
jgi:hypothetical protein